MEKPLLNVVKLSQIPIFQQLQWEEALLRADERNWCLINSGSPPAIVMGISGQIDLLINQEKIKCKPIPLIRRFSGGGTVVVDHNTLFVTFVCQTDALSVQPFPKYLMDWTANIYEPLFATESFSIRENDYVFGDRKWGGNAQSITRKRWLHHSSLLWDYEAEMMDYLLLPKKMPEYRSFRTHTDFLCRLSEFWEGKEAFLERLTQQIEKHFEVEHRKMDELIEIASLSHRKTTVLIEY